MSEIRDGAAVAADQLPPPARCHVKGRDVDQACCGCFAHVTAWIFDLDNTLYPANSHLFPQVAERMNTFLMERFGLDRDGATTMRREYYLEYGTTLAGLMTRHNMEPDDFLDYVHDVDHSVIRPHPELGDAISQLPGKKYIFTNGSVRHAENCAHRLEILEVFDGIHDIKACNYEPKPEPSAFASFTQRFDVAPGTAAMFEDLPHNLATAHDLGITTVLVASDYIDHPSQNEVSVHDAAPTHIHHVTHDIEAFVRGIGR